MAYSLEIPRFFSAAEGQAWLDDQTTAGAMEPISEIPPKSTSPSISDSPAVEQLLTHPDPQTKMLGSLAQRESTTAGQITKVLVENNGARRIGDIAQQTGIPPTEVRTISEVVAQSGILAVEDDVVIAEPLLPKLPPKGDIFISYKNL